jgi:hypothetical protein
MIHDKIEGSKSCIIFDEARDKEKEGTNGNYLTFH